MRTSSLISLFALCSALLLGGCGDDDSSGTPDAAAPDGMVDATPDAMLDATADATPDAVIDGMVDASDGGDGGMMPCAPNLLVTTSDFATAQLFYVDTMTLAPQMLAMDLPDQDTLPTAAGCSVALLQRANGIVQYQMDADPLMSAGTVDVNPAGAMPPYAANPQRVIAVSPAKAYVIQGSLNEVTIIDPSTFSVTGSIDLSGFVKPADTDGGVNATDAIQIGDRLYVGLGNYYFDATGINFTGSELAVIDTTTDMVVDLDAATDGVQGIDLQGENPWRGLVFDAAANRLLVGATGDSFAIDGSIEIVDLAMGTAEASLLTEMELGQEIGGYAYVSPTRLYVLTGSCPGGCSLQSVDPSAAAPTATMVQADTNGILLHEGVLYAWGAGGLRTFDPETAMETTPGGTPVALGTLPIYGVAPAP
ncbi:MAG: hypothetical protein AAGF12_00245 [Myxococcota bacterium]